MSAATGPSLDPEPAAGTRIQSVARAAQLLLWIAKQRNGATAKEIAHDQGLALPTAYHLLNTLIDEGLLAKNANRRYVVGRNVAILARAYLRGNSVPEALLSAVRELAQRTEETAYLADWGDNNEIRVLASVEGKRLLRVAEVGPGPYEHGHARASGKVLLAHAPPELREAYLANHPVVARTPNTIRHRLELERELKLTRKRGYGYDQEEYAVGVSCISAPVLHDGQIVAALGLAVPTERFKRDRDQLTATLIEFVSGLRATENERAAHPG